MSCSGLNISVNCSVSLDTNALNDGIYTIYFNATDYTGNLGGNSTSAIIDNNPPSISISSPSNIAYGTVSISAIVTDPGIGVSNVKVRWEYNPITDWVTMSCSGTERTYTCTYSWNTLQFPDGLCTIRINATDKLGRQSTQTRQVTISNQAAGIVIISPGQYLKGSVNFIINITDSDGVNKSSARYVIHNQSGNMACTELNGTYKLNCTASFNSSLISDGNYTLTFSANDTSGDIITSSRSVRVDNLPPTLVSMSVSPLTATTSTTFNFIAYLVDHGSYVSSATGKVYYPDGSSKEITFQESGNWSSSIYVDKNGKYTLDLSVVDGNSNFISFKNVSSFNLGLLSCGNGVCDADENYCLCPSDCTAPLCTGDLVIDCSSGNPICAYPSAIYLGTTTTTTKPWAELPFSFSEFREAFSKNYLWIILSVIAMLILLIIIKFKPFKRIPEYSLKSKYEPPKVYKEYVSELKPAQPKPESRFEKIVEKIPKPSIQISKLELSKIQKPISQVKDKIKELPSASKEKIKKMIKRKKTEEEIELEHFLREK